MHAINQSMFLRCHVSYRLPVQMRTTFDRIYSMMIFLQHDRVLYTTEKLNSRETQREREQETECCCERVTAWAINLTDGENIYDS